MRKEREKIIRKVIAIMRQDITNDIKESAGIRKNARLLFWRLLVPINEREKIMIHTGEKECELLITVIGAKVLPLKRLWEEAFRNAGIGFEFQYETTVGVAWSVKIQGIEKIIKAYERYMKSKSTVCENYSQVFEYLYAKKN